MKIYLKALGCRLNEAELENWAIDFQNRGHDLIQNPDDADLVVVNTCAVTQEAVKKSTEDPGFKERAHQIDLLTRVLAWYDEHLKN